MKPMDVGRPERIEERQDGSDLVITHRWIDWTVAFLTPFAAVWDGFLIFWYRHVPANAPSITIWFPLLHVGVGIGLTYFVLAKWLNRTSVRVGQGRLRVSTGPLPMGGDKTMATSTIKQLYARAEANYSRGGRIMSYSLQAVLTDGGNTKVIGGLAEQEEALYMEHRIETFLGIEDAPVKGEIR